MTDRDPTVPDGGTSELEPVAPARTEPIDPREPATPPPPGGYASLGRSGPGIPGGLIVVAVLILAVGFLIGFLVGGAGDDEAQPARDRVEQEGGGQGGGQGGGGQRARRERRAACREMAQLQTGLIDLQRQALANQVALTEAVIAEDPERIEALTTAGEALQAQIGQTEGQVADAAGRCRPG
jgi:hypothetical protein